MIDHPFTIFRPFADRLDVKLFVKEDNLLTDEDLQKLLGSEKIASLWQKHGNRTLMLNKPTSRTEQADAIITDAKNLWITIRAADCQQLVVYAPKQHVVGVVHAGWKGLKAGMIPAFFKDLKESKGVDASETLVGVGPSLCTNCAEFTDPVTELEGLDPAFFHGRNADLRGIADKQLIDAGVPKANIERMPDCTKCRSDMYWSYRGGDREKVVEGYTDVIACRLK